MARLWPQFTASTNRGNRSWWTGILQPTALSDSYRIGFSYTVPERPKIEVLSPELKLHPGYSRLPHVFEDGTLCVHTAWEWHGDLLIARTIVPWVCIWLYFYEVWYTTGCWLGEGTHPELPEHKAHTDIANCC